MLTDQKKTNIYRLCVDTELPSCELTYQERQLIGTDSERGSKESVLSVHLNDDDNLTS